LGHYEEAASAFEQALAIVEVNGDRAEQAVIRSSLGVTALSLHRYATALTHLQEGLTIAKALEDPRAEGYIMNALGNVYYEVGDQRRAKDCYQQAMQLRRRIRDRKGEGWSLHYLGRSQAEVGEIEEARRLQEQALHLADEIGDAELQVGAKLALTAVHRHLGGRGAAKTSLRYAQQAVELSRVNGLHREESIGLSHQAMALLLLSKVEAARTCSEEAVQQLEEAGGSADQREWIWLHHAQVLRVCGQEELADRYLRRSYEGVMERLATIRDVRVRGSMLNSRLVREIMGERAIGGSHDVTVSG
jgi:tetratricopeptide (TPR) repeat protein